MAKATVVDQAQAYVMWMMIEIAGAIKEEQNVVMIQEVGAKRIVARTALRMKNVMVIVTCATVEAEIV